MKLKWNARAMARRSASALMAVAVAASFTPGAGVALAQEASGGVPRARR